MKKYIIIIFLFVCFSAHAQKLTGVKATGVRVGFKPTDFPGCVLWLETDPVFHSVTLDQTTPTNRVTQWSDLSGQGNHVSQTTLANKPAYGLTTQNGFPTIRCDGSQRLFAGNTSITNVISGDDIHFTAIYLVKQDASGNDICFAWGNATNSASSFHTFRNFISPNDRTIRTDDVSTAANANISAASAANVWQLSRFLFNGTTWQGGMNGSVNSGNQNVGPLTTSTFCVGAFQRNGAFANGLTGDLLSIVVYNRRLEPADAFMVDQYINQKYKAY